MAAPPKTPEEFLTIVEESNLVAPADLVEFLRKFAAGGLPTDAKSTAERLCVAGLLTTFQANQLLQGRTKGFFLGRYRIQRLIGVGAMGKVYLAEHVLMARQVALKTLPLQRANEGSAVERFQREARAIGHLNHPNIVQAYDFDREGPLWFLALEYVDGANLQVWVYRHGPAPWPQACEFAAQACAGLQHAADQGVVHRDVKPGNLLLDRTGVVKVLDMGLARIFGEFREKHEQPLTIRYDENTLGTADYLAPEQAENSHTVDVRADIYSLGLTLYYLLTGQTAVEGNSVAEKLRWQFEGEPPPLAEVCPTAPAELDAVLRKMIAKRRDERFAFPSEVRKALAPFCRQVRASFELDTAVRRRKFAST